MKRRINWGVIAVFTAVAAAWIIGGFALGYWLNGLGVN